jgi:acyl carrier protein
MTKGVFIMSIKDIVRDFIINNIAESSNGNGIGDTDSLLDTGVLDSFGIMKLLSFLEERFQMQLDSQELMPENFDTIDAISHLISARAA